MDTTTANTSTRQTAINGLAVVGFITLITLGVLLAVYSMRYVPNVTSYFDTAVPNVISRIGTAAATLSQIFTPALKPTLSVVPTASTTISFGKATSTRTTPTPTPTPKKSIPTVPKTVGEEITSKHPINGTDSTQTLFGLPDLVTTINAVGYSATSSTESSAMRGSFVASSTVPTGFRPAVHFTIKNIGTNASGSWRFSASIPTQSSTIYQSKPEDTKPLNPGDSIEYIIAFDQATAGTDKMISITANFDRAVAESNIDNNSAAIKITILGS